MASTVFQGLQSCLEHPLIEPRVLRHKLSPKKSKSPKDGPQVEEENANNKKGELGGWCFIKALATTTRNFEDVSETEKVYVHPLVKSSSSTLSKRSLEMCTESLGSETGSDISESSDEFSVEVDKNSNQIPRSKPREMLGRKPSRGGSFPPPLTSIRSSDTVQVRPHREGGRLVIKAVTVTSCNGCFQAQRGGGRLRLCLLTDSFVLNCHNEEIYDDDVDDDVDDDEEEEGRKCDDDDDVDDKWIDFRGGNCGNAVGEIEIGELPCCRPSRCKEGNDKGISNWEQFWVAIS